MQTYTITTGVSLSNAAFHRTGGSSAGAAHWWLKNNATGEFEKLPRRIRGDEDGWTMDVELQPGHYTLGVGRGKDAIRSPWEATAEGAWV